MANKTQIIYNDSIAELERLREEYAFIGRKSKLDPIKLTLTVQNVSPRKKKARKLSTYEKLARKYD